MGRILEFMISIQLVKSRGKIFPLIGFIRNIKTINTKREDYELAIFNSI